MGTNAPVADPTGLSASAPSGDYAGQATGASPYAANMDYAQSPTPFQGQGAPGGPQPPAGGWQPGGVGGPSGPGGGSKPITQQWWFWTGAAVLVVILAISGVVWAMSGSSDEDNGGSNKAGGTTSSQQSSRSDSGSKSSSGPDSSSDGKSGSDKSTSGKNNGPGSNANDPIDPKSGPITLKAGKYDDDPDASVDVTFGDVEWNANETLKASTNRYSYEEPPAGKVYMQVPVEITYHGQGQFNAYRLKVGYTHEGNTAEAEITVGGDTLFSRQSMPRDGGTAKGVFVFLIDEATANDGKGAFTVSAFSQVDSKNEVYVAAK
ncbi:hypothetical protein [Actinomyces sp. ZJ308]|uniref:hypothetical protein n=1 Tax=Actinomyces sp. ZJ308 TaxID=2708342 RepID=UPI001FBBF036|nr:hypothetical protein [Actinomyces sp. ZJ308]